MPRTRQSNQQYEIVLDAPRVVSKFLTSEYFDMAKELKRDIQCCVCLDPWLDCKRCACMMPCGHAYHFACFAQMQDGRCAICRQ